MPEPAPATPVVPPPTSDIIVRTLASDMAAVTAAGGATASLAPAGVAVEQPHPIQAGQHSHFVSSLLGYLAAFLAIVALGVGGWYGYRYLASDAELTVLPPSATAPTSTLPVAAISQGPLAALPATVPSHRSLLAKAAPVTVSFPLQAPVGTLKTRFQLMREGLDRIPASARVAEIVPTDAGGRPLSFPGYAVTVGAADLMAKEDFTDYLQDDFTLLAVRGQGGFGAAYVLTLKPDTAWLYAQPGVRALEASSGLANLFLQIPGVRTSEFADGTVSDVPVRTAAYGNPVGEITYGYFRDRLIIATSRQALDEALLLLCFAPRSC